MLASGMPLHPQPCIGLFLTVMTQNAALNKLPLIWFYISISESKNNVVRLFFNKQKPKKQKKKPKKQNLEWQGYWINQGRLQDKDQNWHSAVTTLEPELPQTPIHIIKYSSFELVWLLIVSSLSLFL